MILYGGTAVLFNHSNWFTPTERHEVSAATLAQHAASLTVQGPGVMAGALTLLRTFPVDDGVDDGVEEPPVLDLSAVGAPTLHGSYRIDGMVLADAKVHCWPWTEFTIQDGERQWAAELGFDGELDLEPAEETHATLRRQLLASHLQHGDPGYLGSRSL